MRWDIPAMPPRRALSSPLDAFQVLLEGTKVITNDLTMELSKLASRPVTQGTKFPFSFRGHCWSGELIRTRDID